MRTATVTIDGQAVELREKKPRDNMAWRKQFESELGGVVEFVATAAEGWEGLTFDQPADLVTFVRQAGAALLPAIDKVHALCVAYDGRFEEAYESECLDALPELLLLAFPLGGVLERAIGLMNGSSIPPTGPSSPVPNGAATGKTTGPTRRSSRN